MGTFNPHPHIPAKELENGQIMQKSKKYFFLPRRYLTWQKKQAHHKHSTGTGTDTCAARTQHRHSTGTAHAQH